MQPFRFRLLLFLFLITIGLQTRAQTVCTGSLGDPVINQDFGSGGNPGAPLPATVTDYTYTTDACPPDGSYTIASRTAGCFSSSWHTVLQDHTGNPNGYMMIINASNNPGRFFSQRTTVGALCQNTTYEFSAWIMNLILPSSCGGASSKPNITFIIETPSGTPLQTFRTPDIQPTSAPLWVQQKTFFTTPAGVTDVVVRMINNAPGGCGNDLLLDDITFRACGPVVQAGFAGQISVSEQNVCENQPANYTITANPSSGYSNPAYQWQQNLNNGAGWADIAGQTGISLNVVYPSAQLGSYQYRLGVAESANIGSLNCRVYSNAVTINVTAYPSVPFINPIAVCEGEVLTLAATGGATYLWEGPGLAPTTQNPVNIPNASVANGGRYTVTVTSAAGCQTIGYADVTIMPKPVIVISGTQDICRGSSTSLSALTEDALSYRWSPAVGLSDATMGSPVASPTVSTLYTVTVTGSNGCTNTAQVQVNVIDLPVADAGGDKKIFQGQSVQLDGSATGNILSYTWSPADYLDNPNSPTPVATPVEDITYTLTVVSANNCGTAQSDVFVRVFKKIVIPNTFSPNGDGINDIWNIEALETYPLSNISIFNRGGKQVFNQNGYSKPWTGMLNSQPLPAGTYYYVIDLKNDTPPLSGWVLIAR